jgi:RimJ/RimL family protein N-acetyltransferase
MTSEDKCQNDSLTPNESAADVRLRTIEAADLPVLYEFQLDTEANRLAATHPRNVDQFNDHWETILNDPSVTVRAIQFGDELAGCISCFKSDEHDSIGYWIGKDFWGKGVATQALRLLLGEVSARPLHARVAVSNVGSLRVLQKCGFGIIDHRHSPADERYLECEEAILELAKATHQ